MTDRIASFESLAFDAWPAEEVHRLGGWRLRCNGGVTNRANSVWPNEIEGDLSLAERLDAVERWYGARRQAPLFQVTAIARPSGLDEALAHRGYSVHLPTELWTAPAILALPPPAAAIRVDCRDDLDDAWWDLSGRRGRFRGDEIPFYRRLVERLSGRACFALASIDGEPGASGIGVAGGGRVGIFAMRTLEHLRRRGLARALLSGIADFARRREAAELYLQVERDNVAARALYASAGFRPEYGYHYRRLGT
jgi:ribosomal protein S18 acetylase RimI-like enzyme